MSELNLSNHSVTKKYFTSNSTACFYLSSKTCLTPTRQVYQNILTRFFLKTKFGQTFQIDSFYLDKFLLVSLTILLDFDYFYFGRLILNSLLQPTYSTCLLRPFYFDLTTFTQIS